MPIDDCYDSIRTIASYTRTNLTTNLPAQRRFDRILDSADGLLYGHYAKLQSSFEPLTSAFLTAIGGVNDSITSGASPATFNEYVGLIVDELNS